MLRQLLSHVIEVVRSEADAKFHNRLWRNTSTGKVFASASGLGSLQCSLEVLSRGLMNIKKLPPQPRLVRLFG